MKSAPINLSHVRRLFASPARVDGAQFLFREIARRMAEKLDLIKIDSKCVLDLGCGSGADLQSLVKRFPDATTVVGVDSSFQALNQFQDESVPESRLDSFLTKFLSGRSKRQSQVKLVCADFANLPIAGSSFDVLWSNLALHWHPEPDQVLREWFRVLSKNGLVMFSSFGPDTLREIRQAFAAIDDFPHTLPFVDMHDLGDMLVAAGFATPVMDVERITLTYADLDSLFCDVRAFGGNPLSTQRHGLMGKSAMKTLRSEFEKKRGADGRMPITIEVIFGHAFKPIPTRTAAGESIIRLDFPKK